MRPVFSIFFSMFAYLIAMPTNASTCEFFGNKDFEITFNVTGPANNSYVLLEHNGNTHPNEILWFTNEELSGPTSYFYESDLRSGYLYNIRIEHSKSKSKSKSSAKLEYFRKLASESSWQLIGTQDDVDLKNGKLLYSDSGGPISGICSGTKPIDPPTQQCTLLPEENFNSGSLSNWSVMGFGKSDNPVVSDQRFILNSNKQYQATASAYNYVFPSDQNYLEIEFDHYAYGGNGADGVALVISDASVPPKTGAFGGPLGYGMKLKKYHSSEVSQDVEGFAGGWLGVGIDEFGNFWREGGDYVDIRSDRHPDRVVVRGSGETDNGKWLKGYPFIKESEYSGVLDGRENIKHRYKVVLNSRNANAMTLAVFRKIGENGDWDRVIDEFDVLQNGGFKSPPENLRLSITASTGYDRNTHAIDNFLVCADKYQQITDGIHHFEFDYAGTGSICQASEVTLRACMNESCTETYPSSVLSSNPSASTEPITVSLLPQSSSLVEWSEGDSVTFSDSISLKLQAKKSGSATLGIASYSVPQFGFEGAKCRIAGGKLSEENCTISFNSAALGVNVPDKVAGKQFFNDDGQAQYSNQNSPYLEFCSSPSQQGGNGETRDVQLSIEIKEPINNAVSIPAYVSFKKRDGNFSSEVLVGTSSVDIADVYFNSQGKAYFDLRYPEAGKVVLKAKIKGEEDSLGQNSFVSFPKYLTVTTDGECSSGSCQNGFVAAGEPFTMTVTAHQFGGAEAKNYQQTGLVISHKVSYPTSELAIPGKLNVSVYDHTQPENGAVSIEQTVSEVGAFEFTVTPPDSYLGSSAFPIAPAVTNIGRFYPKYFRVYDGVDNAWAYPSGQSFTYMRQPFGASEFYVEALNSENGSVNNYQFFESRLQAQFSLIDSGSYTSRFSSLKTYSGNWLNNQLMGVDSRSIGRFVGSISDAILMDKNTTSYQPDGPLNLYQNSSDTEISISGLGVSENVDPVVVDGNEGLLSIQPDIRFGRVNLDDVGGRQGDTLRIPLRVEYWNGSRFIANPNDSQTDVNGVKAAQQHIWPTDNSAKDVTLGDGGAVSSGSSRSVTATQAESYRQQTRVWLDLEANDLPWLKYNWDKDLAGEENPSSVVTFGIHRGNDRVIYRGEPGLTAQ